MNQIDRCLADSPGVEVPLIPFAAASAIPVASTTAASAIAERALHPAHSSVLVAPANGVRTSFVLP